MVNTYFLHNALYHTVFSHIFPFPICRYSLCIFDNQMQSPIQLQLFLKPNCPGFKPKMAPASLAPPPARPARLGGGGPGCQDG